MKTNLLELIKKSKEEINIYLENVPYDQFISDVNDLCKKNDDFLSKNKPSWLTDDDIIVAKSFYKNGNKLLAIKHLYNIAKPHLTIALKWAADFVKTFE